MSRRLPVAITASIAIVVGAPVVGQLRAAIQSAVPEQYRLIIGSAIVVAVGSALVMAIARIRDRRALRYGALGVSLGVGLIYARLSSTGNPNVDVVERFHFVEYGLLTWLFYGVWREREDVAPIAGPILAALLVGIGDESLQWFIPARIGELHDVMLDGAAAVCGLLFSLGADPPRLVRLALDRGRARAASAFVLATMLCGAAFFHVVHIGFEIDDGATIFRSRFSADALAAARRDREERWRKEPPLEFHRWSREDQYLSEGLWHVQRRNETVSAGDLVAAWRENLIVERFFTPVLDTHTYASPEGTRWPAEQRVDMFTRGGGDARVYVSDANPYPIYTWSIAAFWIAIAVAAVLAVVCCRALERRGERERAIAL